MSRMEEYKQIKEALREEPPALSYTINRASARLCQTRRKRRLFSIPIGGAVLFFAAFVAAVNLSVTFASACGRIPLLRELAAAVAFSPSLSAAVKNEFVQPIEQEQTINGVTMRVEYLIVDQKQVNIFYSLRAKDYGSLTAYPYNVSGIDEPLPYGPAMHGGGQDAHSGFRLAVLEFAGQGQIVPEALRITFAVFAHVGADTAAAPAPPADAYEAQAHTEPEPLTAFTFDLAFDPQFTASSEVVVLNQAFVLDGQTIVAESVEILPTHLRLNLADDDSNTAWLQGISFYMEDEKGRRFEGIQSGITATGTTDTPFMRSFRLESPYFAKSESFTLAITEATWLDKDKARAEIDLLSGFIDVGGTDYGLPEGAAITALREGSGWRLSLTYDASGGSIMMPFRSDYYDASGNEHFINSWSHTIRLRDGDPSGAEYETVDFVLKAYPYDTVYLAPLFTRQTILDTPVYLPVK